MTTCETASASIPTTRGCPTTARAASIPRRRDADPGRVRARTSRSRWPSPSRPRIPTIRSRWSASTRRTSSSTASTSRTAIRRTVAVIAKRAPARSEDALPDQRWPGPQPTAHEWRGGERYGFENDDYYAEYRGKVQGRRRRRHVEVWFTGGDPERRGRRRTASRASTSPTPSPRTRATVLVIADEDYNGVNPDDAARRPRRSTSTSTSTRSPPTASRPTSGTSTPRACPTTSACSATTTPWSGISATTGSPRTRRTSLTELPSSAGFDVPDSSVAEREQYLTMAVRDYLERGRQADPRRRDTAWSGCSTSCSAARWAASTTASTARRISPASSRSTPFSDCLLLANDFAQYYLGAYAARRGASGVRGHRRRRSPATEAAFGGPATVDNPIDEAGGFPADERRPAAGSVPAVRLEQRRASTSGWQAASTPSRASSLRRPSTLDESYMRLGSHVRPHVDDGRRGADDSRPRWRGRPKTGYDHVIVEAHTVGTGRLDDAPRPRRRHHHRRARSECEQGFLHRAAPAAARTT